MVRDNKTCILCGKKYSYCSGCAEFDHLPRWMACYCSENCKDIFYTLSSYNMKHKTKKKAKELLEKCDLTNTGTYSEFNQSCINEIMTEETSNLDMIDSVVTVTPVSEDIIKLAESVVNDTTSDPDIENRVSDPVMNTAVKQPKRMKYVGKKNN